MRLLPLSLVVLLAGCTFGAPSSSVAPVAGGNSAIVTVDVDLTLHPQLPIDLAGIGGGFSPAIVRVGVGAMMRFTNSDSFAHTATSLTGRTFPDTSPFDSGALTLHGERLSAGFSSGVLAAGGSSQAILADEPGTYLYGCFFHYGAPMRAEIIVQ